MAITAATCGGVSVAGRPERGWSVRAARPTALKRLSQVRTVSAGSWSCCAIAGTRCPWCARRMMRARSTCRAAAVRAWAHFSIVSCSSVLSTLSLIARGIPPEEMPLIVEQICRMHHLGDGLLVYFGYPHAHEDDAQRAVRTGLGMLVAMGDLNSRLQQDKGIQLGIRIGVHTGLVVVGAMGGGGRQEQLALGETPNVAARIQGLAASDALVISETTYRLIQGYFEDYVANLASEVMKGQ